MHIYWGALRITCIFIGMDYASHAYLLGCITHNMHINWGALRITCITHHMHIYWGALCITCIFIGVHYASHVYLLGWITHQMYIYWDALRITCIFIEMDYASHAYLLGCITHHMHIFLGALRITCIFIGMYYASHAYLLGCITHHMHIYWDGLRITTQIARFMRPTLGPPGSCRSLVGPYWLHKPCYQGIRAATLTKEYKKTVICAIQWVSRCTLIGGHITVRETFIGLNGIDPEIKWLPLFCR